MLAPLNTLSETAFVPSQGLAPDGSKTLSYAYDALDELTGEGSSSAGNYRDNYGDVFGYDLAGNLSGRGSGGVSYNLDNQISGFSYDGNGNPVTYEGRGFTFDAENRLTGIGSLLSATYDPDGLRATKTATPPGASRPLTTYFLYDGETPLLEEDAAGQVTAANGMAASFR